MLPHWEDVFGQAILSRFNAKIWHSLYDIDNLDYINLVCIMGHIGVGELRA